MRYYDISLNLSTDTVRWVVAPPLEVHERRRISRGDEVNASALTVSVHAGTHVDAPLHFVPGGVSIDAVPLERFVGPAVVHQVDADRFITEAHVKAIALDGARRVLFKTRNSELLKRREYDPNFVAFSVEAARALVARRVELVGLDYLSVAHADQQVPVHRAFLDHGVVLLEGVDLSEVAPGRYELICFPLRLRGLDGAPCRAVLRDLTG
ncbi:MAG: arylformamidase [Candidatus Rokuibacteriota bacterium]|nr:MAG: arylformamidase [Candidatus Rokubacteria bacterium]